MSPPISRRVHLGLAVLAVAAGAAWPKPATAAPEPLPPAREPFVVALDAGHGGTNLGTGIAGVHEKEITLELARRIRKRLAAEADVKVVLCRDADVLVPIRARVRCGNEAGARLFLSLHVNASPEGPSRGTQQGFEVYVLPPDLVTEEARKASLLAGDDADAAFLGQRVRAAAEDSATLARRIAARLDEASPPGSNRGVKQVGASLDVLRGLTMAAALVEVGFLDHPDDVVRLTHSDGLDALAGALARAILDMRTRDDRVRTGIGTAPLRKVGPSTTRGAP